MPGCLRERQNCKLERSTAAGRDSSLENLLTSSGTHSGRLFVIMYMYIVDLYVCMHEHCQWMYSTIVLISAWMAFLRIHYRLLTGFAYGRGEWGRRRMVKGEQRWGPWTPQTFRACPFSYQQCVDM